MKGDDDVCQPLMQLYKILMVLSSVPGADKDKMELIGHASGEMLRYYQDVGLEDLRKITDKL